MKNLSSKNKLILLLLVWLLVSGGMFLYFFPILDNSNQQILNSMATNQKDLALLLSESESYKQAQDDLQKLTTEPLQPDDFFSRDINLVNEIQALEDLATKYNVQMQLSGISGTVNTAGKAPTITPIVTIPYSIVLNGDLGSVVNFIENLEHLSFVVNLTSFSINASGQGTVTASLSSNFYLRKD